MAQIKHIAIRTHDVEKTAAFYKEAFGLEQVGVGQSGVYLTDGRLNIAILNFRPVVEGESMKLGVDHIGFAVDDVDSTVERIKKLGGKALNERLEVAPPDPSKPQSYFEVKCVGPEDQVIDVSNAGWIGAK
ncbi:MAG TPA: VOC family protein [Candidatus Binatia bacterium]|jgi:methylmalonyl-CoA/ethylmalonyl-CoA epimerase